MKVKMILDNCFEPDLRVYKEALYLVKNNNDVEILCLDKKNKFKDKENEEIDKIKIKRFFPRTEKTTKLIEKNIIIRKLKLFIYFWWLIKFLLQAKKYLKNEEYDILHCHDITMAFFAVILFRNKKIVFDMHEYYKDRTSKISNWIIDKMVRYTQNKSKWIIYLNDFQKKDVRDKNLEKLVYLPNYPEKFKFENLKHKDAEKIRICYTGIIRHKQELINLMEAAKDLNNIEIYINGNGPYYEDIKALENSYNNVYITGAYKHSDIINFYENTDVSYIVYDSSNINNKTALPTKFFESVIAKIPVIVAQDSKMGQFVQENDIGFLIEENSECIRKTLEEISKNKNLLNDKIENIKKISNNYTWEKIVNNLQKIYKEGK